MSNGVQSFLSLGAMMIFSLISLRFDTAVLQNTEVEVENKVYLTAFSLADDLLEEIKQRAFDEKTVDFKAITTSALTPSANLGKDSGEEWPNFNDIDDYNDYTKPVSLPHAEKYTVISKINYVLESDQDQISSDPTYFKRVTIFVESPYLKHQIKLSYIFTLHSK
ncbi:MAG TPA: hypothetical protein VF870_11165 [Ignavibacteriaceae bacterium]|jgi:hypothetical protein